VLLAAPPPGARGASVTVPVILDHNRMLVDAEIQRKDGTWRTARLWVDTGNPLFFICDSLAHDLGIEPDGEHAHQALGGRSVAVRPPAGVRIGGLALDFSGVQAELVHEPHWLFATMHNDATLPATVLKRYQVILDYPGRRLTLAEPGSLRLRGTPVTASIQPETGVVQMDAQIGNEVLSLALDNGASYSFVSDERVERLSRAHPDWRRGTGAAGCANIWGWWRLEEAWTVLRVPEMRWGSVRLADVGLVGLPRFVEGGPDIGRWYSKKTVRPVDGFLGPNAFKAFRVGIDYAKGTVYFEKRGGFDSYDMDLVGLTLRLLADGRYEVIGVARRDGRPVVEGVEPGDHLLQVGELAVTGVTMGTVVDALRGKPGETRTLVLERGGRRFTVLARVERLL
jgi:hypothetical protein